MPRGPSRTPAAPSPAAPNPAAHVVEAAAQGAHAAACIDQELLTAEAFGTQDETAG